MKRLESADTRPALIRVCERHYAAAAIAILTLAAFNLGYRLDSEVVTEWDESLYAHAAWEMFQGGSWIGTTLFGVLDYSILKPPLSIWLIVLSFKALGTSLLALRLPSAIAAWLTVLALQEWSRRTFGRATALFASLVLATSFGFLYVHSGRSGNPDAVFTLLILLTVITLWAARERPWRSLWLGPLMAGLFLVRGLGMLMPLAIVCVFEAWTRGSGRERVRPLVTAAVLFLIPVASWIVLRWQVDRWQFLGQMFALDLVARTSVVVEGHAGTPLYYLHIIQKDHYDWLAAALLAAILFPIRWSRFRRLLTVWRDEDGRRVLLGSWAAATLLVPTLMQTKLPWYVNSFYPVFALGIAAVLVYAFSQTGTRTIARRRCALGIIAVISFGVAEGKLLWYSWNKRDLRSSVQGLMLAEKHQLTGRRVFRESWDRADTFVLRALAGASGHSSSGLDEFLARSEHGDYLIGAPGIGHAGLTLVRLQGPYGLYRRSGEPTGKDLPVNRR